MSQFSRRSIGGTFDGERVCKIGGSREVAERGEERRPPAKSLVGFGGEANGFGERPTGRDRRAKKALRNECEGPWFGVISSVPEHAAFTDASGNLHSWSPSDEKWDAGSLADPFQPPTGTGANAETGPPSVAQPEAEENTTNSSAATVAARPCKWSDGRLGEDAENEVRAELLREEHRIRVRILQADHEDEILETRENLKIKRESSSC
ncbi:hypothetical protein HPB52_024036 [Rhipicephalus sanguineus]|uniref:Uncharacterized protein n=1 Tax=Rhipicephalus sanguineus TaxID=34632 RepID=A0A9D4PY90_RHISA|nr:hypothetical protein HPB52_024036 [Rhipicephalus sanguineus]